MTMNRLTILDGGMGRELKEIGAPFSQPLWSAQALIEAPQFVTQAHQHFIDAGAELIITNSYACVPFHLGEKGFAEQGFELAELSGKLAQSVASAAKSPVAVAGAIHHHSVATVPIYLRQNKQNPLYKPYMMRKHPMSICGS